MRHSLAIRIVIALTLLPSAFSQTLPAARPRFESASVKRNTTGGQSFINPGFVNILPGGRLTAGWAVLRTLIQEAYGVEYFQLGEGPDWMDTEHYDIEAQAKGDVSEGQMLLMLQSLLEDKFKLKVHRETREYPVYALTIARSGLKLRPSKEGNCFPPLTLPPPTPPLGRGSTWSVPPLCGRAQVSLISASEARLTAGRVSMKDLTEYLSKIVGSTVTDKTGVVGTFDAVAAFTPDKFLAGIRGSATAPRPGEATSRSFFSALEQQLGLKLQATKGAVEVLVIDHVERPSEN